MTLCTLNEIKIIMEKLEFFGGAIFVLLKWI